MMSSLGKRWDLPFRVCKGFLTWPADGISMHRPSDWPIHLEWVILFDGPFVEVDLMPWIMHVQGRMRS